jgi:hypothetical protein
VDKYWQFHCLFLGVLLDARDGTLWRGVIISWNLPSHLLSQEDKAVNIASQWMKVSKWAESINHKTTQMETHLGTIKKQLGSLQKKQTFTKVHVQTLQG